ncbi:MAG: hypothetical protein ABL986_12230 [Vicinamibacterales bacterium]
MGSSLDELAARFTAATLPKDEWTHHAHLAVGMWHVHRYGPDEALTRLRTRIVRLNDSHGTPNSETRGYHETITRAYVLLLSELMKASPQGTSAEDLAARLLRSALAQPDALLTFYSRERLMSPAARAAWHEPDLNPLRWPEEK